MNETPFYFKMVPLEFTEFSLSRSTSETHFFILCEAAPWYFLKYLPCPKSLSLKDFVNLVNKKS